MRNLKFLGILTCVVACLSPAAAQHGTFEGYPSITLSNGKLELTIMVKGSALSNLVLADDTEKISPLWNPMRAERELGRPVTFEGGTGHFVCVDGFGAPSAEERAAGLPFHGEAHTETFDVHSERQGSSTIVAMTARLPIVQESFTRTFQAVDGENVIYVESGLESSLGFDRPVNWAEHATLGPPFLESGVTVVDLSGSRSRTRPYETMDNGEVQRRLASGQDFTWPLAPALDGKGLDGKIVDLRQTPDHPHYLDHAATLLDPTRTVEWVTAINLQEHLIFGYLFKRTDYPWLQYWGYYPPNGKFARGMEFSTQPFDIGRREVVTAGPMFDTPTYRWLPAKSTIKSRFLLFYARVPENFRKVDDVRIENGQIVIEDQSAHLQVKLAASRGL